MADETPQPGNEDPATSEAQVEPEETAESLPKKGFLQYINPISLISSLYAKSKLLAFVVIGVFLLIIAVIVVYFLFLRTPNTENTQPEEVIQYSTNYYPLPDVKLRMKRENNSPGYLLIGLTLKLPANAKIDNYRKMEPEILDSLHTYLSSISLDDFSNSKVISFSTTVGLERIRYNITKRLNTILSPLVVESVLFRKLITQ